MLGSLIEEAANLAGLLPWALLRQGHEMEVIEARHAVVLVARAARGGFAGLDEASVVAALDYAAVRHLRRIEALAREQYLARPHFRDLADELALWLEAETLHPRIHERLAA